MQVTLIEYTGIHSLDPWYAARHLAYIKSTRLEQGAETREKFRNMPVEELIAELDYISKTIRSSWEFVDYVFEIKDVTRAFTHQLVRTRTGSYAQQAQRVVDMSNFGVEEPVAIKDDPIGNATWEEFISTVKRYYNHLKLLGFSNQDLRSILPTNVHTNIIAKFNLRTMADLVAKRENLRAQGEYEGVVKEMKRLVLEVHPWAEPFLNPERLKTPNLDKILRERLGNKGPLDDPELNAALKEVDALKGVWG